MIARFRAMVQRDRGGSDSEELVDLRAQMQAYADRNRHTGMWEALGQLEKCKKHRDGNRRRDAAARARKKRRTEK